MATYAIGYIQGCSSRNYGTAELNGKASGYGFNIGLYTKASNKLAFAISYRTQINMKVKDGNAVIVVPEGVAVNFPNGKFTSSLPLPQVVTLGTHYKLNEKIDLVADVNYVGWKAYDTVAFNYENNTASLLDTKSPRLYKNTFAFRTGCQYLLNEKTQLRGGIAYGITPVQQGYVTPEAPDANRWIFTTGASYFVTTHLQIDASLYFMPLGIIATRTTPNRNSHLGQEQIGVQALPDKATSPFP